LPQQGFLSS